ncbi:MAG: PstS family phosphate ABC transporter substrate-binding protein [Magnetococcales bacterium]|nr:PstS family phosphate ABC transporter substrate-binding protein [Magnetococcales bacterium]
MMRLRAFFSIVTLSSLLLSASADARTLIHTKGSDTMTKIASAWSEAYHGYHALHRASLDVGIAVNGGGSGTGIAALLIGQTDIANVSRRLLHSEIKLAAKKGIQPIHHVVAYNALVGVFLHPNNPLNSISFQNLAEIYGEDGTLTKWSQLGVQVPGCSGQRITVVSRQNNSGTYAFFRNAVLGGKRDYKLNMLSLPSSKEVVHLVEETPCAIGYSGMIYATRRVKPACISEGEQASCTHPQISSVTKGLENRYPISRPLFMVTNGQPEGAVKQYLDWIKSDAGQCVAKRMGYTAIRPVSCNMP